MHFPLTLAEVTLGASPGGKVSFRNYLEEETGKLSTLTLLAKILTPLHSGYLRLPCCFLIMHYIVRIFFLIPEVSA